MHECRDCRHSKFGVIAGGNYRIVFDVLRFLRIEIVGIASLVSWYGGNYRHFFFDVLRFLRIHCGAENASHLSLAVLDALRQVRSCKFCLGAKHSPPRAEKRK